MDVALRVADLTKSYEDFSLNISFEINKGYVMGFIGPNGAGKTTTIKLIMNLIHKNSGNIEIFGKDNLDFEKEIKQDIGFVYDDPPLYDNITIKKMTSLYSNFYTNWDTKVYENFLMDFGLNENSKIKTLSKGTKMKYAIALALSHHAKFIIMDEPTSGLDPVFRRHVLSLLQELVAKEETTIFFSSHITSDLDKVADYITFINDGKLVFSEEKDECLLRYHLIKGGNDILNKDLIDSMIGYKKTPFGFEGLTLKNSFTQDVVLEPPTLEDIMFYHNIKKRVR